MMNMVNESPRINRSQLTDYSQDSYGLKAVKDELRAVRDGKHGSQPETKYINKKKEYVRQLMKEKQEAVERGVKEKMKNYESDMVVEMLQAALNLDVNTEVEKRIEVARQMVEQGRSDGSGSKVY